jgi:hypothetical protein
MQGSNRKCLQSPTICHSIRWASIRMEYIRFYHLRVYDRINAPMSEYVLAQMN